MTAGRSAGGVLLALAVATADAAGQDGAPAPAPAERASPSPQDAAKALAAANVERGAGRLEEAENLLREALRDGWSPRLGAALGDLLLQRARGLDASSELMRSLRDGLLGEALALFGRAAADDATRVEAAIGRAACHEVAGRSADADAVLVSALAALRSEGGAIEERRRLVAERVRILAARGDREGARAQILKARTAGDLDDAAAAVQELAVAASTADPQAIGAAALAAVKSGAAPFDVAYRSYDGVVSQEAGASGGATLAARFEALLHLYSKLLEVRPREPALLFYRGCVRMRMGDATGALDDLKPCLEDPDLGERAQLQYGLALVGAGRPEEALPLFEKLAQPGSELLGGALDGIWEVAVARATKRRFAEALPLFREIVAKNPVSLRGRIGEPLCLKSLGEYEQAAAAYEAGIAALPEEPQLLNDYALLLKAHGEAARAIETFERALAAGSPDAGENLGIISYREKRDPELAARYFARTTAMLLEAGRPMRPRVLFFREICLAEMAARPPK